MTEHEVEPCPTPSKSRRWRNALWICPKCRRAWVLRRTTAVAPTRWEAPGGLPGMLAYEGPRWQWFPWVAP